MCGQDKDKTNNLAPDVPADATTIEAAKKACKEAVKKVKEAKHVVAMVGAKPFELYANLLSDKAWQQWKKILKAKVTQAPWEDVFGVPHTETLTKDGNPSKSV